MQHECSITIVKYVEFLLVITAFTHGSVSSDKC